MKLLNKKSKLVIRYFSFTIIGLMISIASITLQAADDDKIVNLILKPNQCVALHQGQKCYSDIELSFTSSKISDYCLYSSTKVNQPLKCWTNSSNGQYTNEIYTVKNIVFTLKQKGSNKVSATAVLEMAWVYRKNSRAKSAWRLF